MLSHRNRGEMHPAGLVPNVGGVREFARPATREVKHVVEAIDIPPVLHLYGLEQWAFRGSVRIEVGQVARHQARGHRCMATVFIAL